MEKSTADINVHSSPDTYGVDDTHLELQRHSTEEIASSGKWYDKKLVPGLPQYSHAMVQIVMLAFVVFMTPGMYNSLTGIGASISDVTTSNNAAVALYSTFASIGFFGGTICNMVGPKSCLIFGGLGYAMYSGSLLCFNHTQNKGFVIFSGAFLGICASCLWAAQGTIIMSYPTENTKGRAIMVFWIIFNLGAVIGSIIPLANNIHNKASSANDGTFVAFIVLMLLGSVIACFMLPMSKVWKADNTRVITQKHPYWKDELLRMARILRDKPSILFMFPMFFASNWFYTYQFNDFNLGRFDLRTRSLNSLLYWFAQMIGAIILGVLLDMTKMRRITRARLGWALLFITGMAIWGGGLKFQLGFNRDNTDPANPQLTPIDYKDGAYIGPMFLYIFYGMYDAMFQTYIFWSLGTLSNNPKTVALYAGFYKGIQSAAAAIAWRLDALKTPYIALFGSSWGLVHGSLLIAAPLLLFRITEHTSVEEDNLQELMATEELKSVKSVANTPAQSIHNEDV